MKINKKLLFIVLPIVVAVLVLDLISKQYIAMAIPMYEIRPFIGGIFNFTHYENTGAAWNIFAGNQVFLIIISVFFIALICVFYFLERKNGTLFHIGIALIFGGAVGNMIDRVFLGFVRDFIQFDFWRSFPVFNLADAALTIGVVLVVLYYILSIFKRGKNAKRD